MIWLKRSQKFSRVVLHLTWVTVESESDNLFLNLTRVLLLPKPNYLCITVPECQSLATPIILHYFPMTSVESNTSFNGKACCERSPLFSQKCMWQNKSGMWMLCSWWISRWVGVLSCTTGETRSCPHNQRKYCEMHLNHFRTKFSQHDCCCRPCILNKPPKKTKLNHMMSNTLWLISLLETLKNKKIVRFVLFFCHTI